MIIRHIAQPHGMAFDRASVRSVDVDGRLHVACSNMSKAAVNAYFGHEIPFADKLGLHPDRIYYLLRDPEELAKAAPSFNNLPILSRHVPVTAAAPQKELIIGSTGTDAKFVAPYLQNSAVVWCAEDIADITAERKKEWSSAYHYRADMTPGVYLGLRYDGVMRDIVGNHVALVDNGRAGGDVVVGDALPGGTTMKRFGLLLGGAVTALVAPKLAMDAKVDLRPVLDKAKRGGDKAKLAASIVGAVKPKLAQDADVDVDAVVQIIEAIEGSGGADDDKDLDVAPVAVDAEDDVMAKVMAFLKGKLSDDDTEALGRIVAGDVAEDDEPEDPKAPRAKPAMDAAAIRREAVAEATRNVRAIADAERKVEPIVGRITVAMDSAAAVYKLALDKAGVPTAGVHESAYGALVDMHLKGREPSAKPTIAQDASAGADFASRFPTAGKLVAA